MSSRPTPETNSMSSIYFLGPYTLMCSLDSGAPEEKLIS